MDLNINKNVPNGHGKSFLDRGQICHQLTALISYYWKENAHWRPQYCGQSNMIQQAGPPGPFCGVISSQLM